MAAAPPLPTRFPCWCRAVYSWGGETKKDLGFIEGDLIECLNAGDGAWWMGRLKRDRRMMGLFPSNFVELLEDDFQPESRSVSPMPGTMHRVGSSISRAASPAPQSLQTPTAKPAPKQKSKFRKPFTAYAAAGQPNPAAAARETVRRQQGLNGTPPGSMNMHRPYSSMKRTSNESRVSSPLPHGQGISQYRATSPVPSRGNSYNSRSRAPSPAPSHFRAVSPAPSVHYQSHSRAQSPDPFVDDASPPPPAPPPHRVAYAQSRAPSPQPYHDDYRGQAGHHTPEPPRSPNPTGGGRKAHTPSPLTSAYNDVMSSLEGMTMNSRHSPELPGPSTPPNIWSPEAFDELYTKRRIPDRGNRPFTSIGIGGTSLDDEDQDNSYEDNSHSHQVQRGGGGGYGGRDNNQTPLVSNYVQRMEDRLRRLQEEDNRFQYDRGPAVPPKNSPHPSRPGSPRTSAREAELERQRKLNNRKSAFELSGKAGPGRTFTTKSTVTNASSTAQSTSTNGTNSTHVSGKSIMSGQSAGAFSATSAGSYARHKWARGAGRPVSVMETRSERPETPHTGITYHSSHDSNVAQRPETAMDFNTSGSANVGNGLGESNGGLGGLVAPKPKKSGFFKKMIESAKTGAASARSTISSNQGARPVSRQKNLLPSGLTGIAGGTAAATTQSSAARDMGLGGGSNIDWIQVRRDVNRSNSLSATEIHERIERCQMLDLTSIRPIDILYETAEGDEGLDGLPIAEATDFSVCNLSLVDKSARFVTNLPHVVTAASLAQGYVCRPYRSDVQRLRAIFTWVAERIAWEEDFEGPVDTRRVLQTKRGCSEEIAVLVMEMCGAVGLHAEVVRGYLKQPGEPLGDVEATITRPNHWWNAVIVDGEWRIMDCALASPTNPKRVFYSSASAHAADGFYFLTRPTHACFTHVPLLPEQQHIVPPVAPGVLLALPCACSPYFRHRLHLAEFETSLLALENLEMAHVYLEVPEDVECVAEVEARAFVQDQDGDFLESGDVVRKRALAQAEWLVDGRKRYTVKALVPGDEGAAVLKVYAGKRGMMTSIKSNPHPLALAMPLTHTGTNPPYDFLVLHPTPHAQRHDLYVAQPQCARIAVNNTFVFTVRQHPASLTATSPNPAASSNHGPAAAAGRVSPNPLNRPASALSMTSNSAAGSTFSAGSSAATGSNSSGANGAGANGAGPPKPAKLAIQQPSGKIIRLMRKPDVPEGVASTSWETIIKIGERGTWRGLVLADRSARWCVFAEWECV
ncbi:hypothetical protein BDY21DRAFT_373120 [Lineolata rhizophorae]|uniref:SH3 domain-containing protein n=1 Tax=Lineolata rhizophorae TaxID=578093 RepID=A0A6A6NUQ3_9PEZI|nr:hypothetical protein BDY21DRAFT_373120 [Lineolata rhizophorae]